MNPQSPQEALAEEIKGTMLQGQRPSIEKLLMVITKHFPPLVEDKGEDAAFEQWWISDDGLSQLPGADGLLCKGVARNAFVAGITYARQQTQLNKVRAQFRASSETGRQYGNQALNKEKGVDEPVPPTYKAPVQPALAQAETQPETCKTGNDLEECCNRIDKCFSTEDLSWPDINFIIRTLKTLQSSNAELRKVVGEVEKVLLSLPIHHAHNCLIKVKGNVLVGKCVCEEQTRTKALAAIAKVKE